MRRDRVVERSAPARHEDLARDWRRLAHRQRLWHAALIAGVAAVAAAWGWLDPEEALFSTAHWPLLMPLVMIFGAMLWTGRSPRGYGTDYRVVGFLAGDRGAVAGYPPVVQAGLLRAVEAGAEQDTLLPLDHRIAWRLGLPLPPVAFMPAWLDAVLLFVAMYTAVPLWLLVQHWWNPSFGGGDTLLVSHHVATVVFALIACAVAAHRADARRRLQLPRWRDFRREWHARGGR